MAKITITKEELEEIKKAVAKAESETSGEIATSFIRESDDYAVSELLFAVICGFCFFFLMLFFTPSVERLIQSLSWDYSVNHLLMFYGFSTFLVIAGCYFIANISAIDRFIVPRSVLRRKVQERAVRHFMESGVYNTRDRTGILIFISELERRVELLADTGISEKIPQQEWDRMVSGIVAGIKQNQLAESLITTIGECGSLLKRHFPIKADDENELSDGLELLEKKS